MWLALPFYDFCGFRSVAVNSVYKLQFFFTFICSTSPHGQMRYDQTGDSMRVCVCDTDSLLDGRIV